VDDNGFCVPQLLACGGLSRRSSAKVEAGIAEDSAIEEGLKQKATQFTESGAEVYAKT
jgi:hypothetical protein